MDTTHHGNPTQTGTEKVGIVGGGKPSKLSLRVEVTPYSVDGVISGEEIHYRGILNNFLDRLASSVVSVDQAQTSSRSLSVCLSCKSGSDEIAHAVITTDPPPTQPVCGQRLVPDHLASRIIENLCRQVGLR